MGTEIRTIAKIIPDESDSAIAVTVNWTQINEGIPSFEYEQIYTKDNFIQFSLDVGTENAKEFEVLFNKE